MPINRLIDPEDIPLVKGMLLRGDPQEAIAWYFGVSNSKISEIKKSTRRARQFSNVPPAPPEDLPPSGPYPSARDYEQMLAVEKMMLSGTIGVDDWRIEDALAQLELSQAYLADKDRIIAALRKEPKAPQKDLEAAKQTIAKLTREIQETERIAIEDVSSMEREVSSMRQELNTANKKASQAWAAQASSADRLHKAKGLLMEQSEKIKVMAKAVANLALSLNQLAEASHTPQKRPTGWNKHFDKFKPDPGIAATALPEPDITATEDRQFSEVKD